MVAPRPQPDPVPGMGPRLAFGPFVLDPAGARLLRDGVAVELAPKPLALLEHLAARPGQLVSKEALLDALWGHRFVSESALKVAVNALRTALGDDAQQPSWVHTVPRRGYRFSDHVRLLDPAPQAGDGAPGAPTAPAAPAATAAAPASPEALPAPAPAAPPSPPAVPGNLPRPGAPLLGREADIELVQAALARHRLVTLTGPGGVGKTRLALRCATDAPPADGVWLLRLDALSAQDPVGPALTRLLGLPEAAGTDAAKLAAALSQQQLRLVLDNAEHMAEDLAAQARIWLEQAPGLQLLVTSQRPLHLAQEQVLPIAPLALPGPELQGEALRGNPAVALLCRRVQAAQPGWWPQGDQWQDLAEIARGLDGLPLALELAAARVPLLDTQGVRQRLHERLRVLTRGALDAPDRHRTLRAAMEWSVGLLPADAAALLDLCAVFVGGFTIEAVQAAAARMLPGLDEWALIDHLELLREMALVVEAGTPPAPLAPERGSPQAGLIAREWFAEPRLRLYDSVRLLGLERLAARGELERAQQAHAAWMRDLLEQAEQVQLELSEAVWLGRMEPELGNFNEAVARTQRALLAAPDGGREAVAGQLAELCTAGNPLWLRCGLREQAQAACRFLTSRLEPASPQGIVLPPVLKARLGLCLGLLAGQGHLPLPEGLQALRQAAPVLRDHGERRRLLLALYVSALLELAADATEAGIDGAERIAAELRAALGASPTLYEARLLPWAEAMIARRRGDLDRFARFFVDMQRQSVQLGDRIEAWKAGWGAAQALFLTGRIDESVDLFAQTLADLRSAGRWRSLPMLVGQAAAIGLMRDARPEALALAREALPLLRPGGQIAYTMGDALPWAAWHQGRTEDALRLFAWSEETARARSERRGFINDRIRAAFLQAIGDRAPPTSSGLDDDAAARLALGPA